MPGARCNRSLSNYRTRRDRGPVAEGGRAGAANDVGTVVAGESEQAEPPPLAWMSMTQTMNSREAVTEYQQAHSLEPDGWAGVATQASIYEELRNTNDRRA